MKRLLILIWYVFFTRSEQDVAKFLNQLPKGTETKIVCSTTAAPGIDSFYVFYDAEKEVKLK
jgi:flavorubredoxin